MSQEPAKTRSKLFGEGLFQCDPWTHAQKDNESDKKGPTKPKSANSETYGLRRDPSLFPAVTIVNPRTTHQGFCTPQRIKSYRARVTPQKLIEFMGDVFAEHARRQESAWRAPRLEDLTTSSSYSIRIPDVVLAILGMIAEGRRGTLTELESFLHVGDALCWNHTDSVADAEAGAILYDAGFLHHFATPLLIALAIDAKQPELVDCMWRLYPLTDPSYFLERVYSCNAAESIRGIEDKIDVNQKLCAALAADYKRGYASITRPDNPWSFLTTKPAKSLNKAAAAAAATVPAERSLEGDQEEEEEQTRHGLKFTPAHARAAVYASGLPDLVLTALQQSTGVTKGDVVALLRGGAGVARLISALERLRETELLIDELENRTPRGSVFVLTDSHWTAFAAAAIVGNAVDSVEYCLREVAKGPIAAENALALLITCVAHGHTSHAKRICEIVAQSCRPSIKLNDTLEHLRSWCDHMAKAPAEKRHVYYRWQTRLDARMCLQGKHATWLAKRTSQYDELQGILAAFNRDIASVAIVVELPMDQTSASLPPPTTETEESSEEEDAESDADPDDS